MIRLSTGLRASMLNVQGFKGAFANGVIAIYTGTQPATADSAVQGTLLGYVTKNAGAFAQGSPTNGLNFDTTSTGTIAKAAAETWQLGTGGGTAGASATGVAGWFRLMGNASDAGGASTSLARLDGSIATSGGDLNLPSVSFDVGTPVTIDTFSFTLPAS